MATLSTRKKLQDGATCPVCLDFFTDPVTLDCGHNFCQACIAQCWGEPPTVTACPQCRESFQPRDVKPNRQLANVRAIAEECSVQVKQAVGDWRVCEKHQEPLKLFCKEDEAPICMVCDRSKEHREHDVVPVEEAAPEYKGQFCSVLENLKKGREKILAFKANAEKESKNFLNQIVAERQKTVDEFSQLHQFLEEQETCLLTQIEEVEKEIARRRDEHLATLSEELSSLDNIIQELEEKCEQSASELLQDVRSTLRMCKEKERFENPVTFPPSVKWRIWDFADRNTLLENITKQFKDNLLFGFQLEKANVTLDPDTAHPLLILAEDHKCVRWGEKWQDLPDNPERFSSFCIVLGCEGFTAGRHCWEVSVGSEGDWAVGVARKSVKRKGRFRWGPEEGIWAVMKLGGLYLPPADVPLHLIGELKRIRVILNCAEGQVAFSDADSAAPICTFSEASFSGETLLPFFWLGEKTSLTLSPFMAALSARKRFEEEATCSVCLDFFTDPVTLDCGHNFCKACIVKCWGESPRKAACPQCRERVQSTNLKPNRQLASVIEVAKELSVQTKQEAGAGRVCERHKEPLKLFCKEEEAPICVVCNRSKEHRAHDVVPLEEAAQEYKDQIHGRLEILRKEREKILEYKADAETEKQAILEQTETAKQKVVAEFRQMHQFLEEQEKRLLAQMEELEREILARSEEHLARLSEELSSLEWTIWEMEEKCQQPAAQLLQEIRNTLESCKKKPFENPVAFPPALKWKIWECLDRNPFLKGIMKQFKVTLLSEFQSQKANVTLDLDTAHPQLILAEYHKNVRCGEKWQDLPNNPERFSIYCFVLGCEEFTAGKHCWEVCVESGEYWAVGVARKSVKRKYMFKWGPEEGIWAVGKWYNGYRAPNSPADVPLCLSGEPKRIRVTLNYAEGQVAFFDADSAAPIYAFLEASFSGETLLPIFYVYGKGSLTLSP
ncbi:zinc finger protein RFP-like [Hemicordylus capensis]|uniref:zinc finger protein RFP-like n=1 Tax=Hemicordylus capensis TaxID=884348 RepID=UPI002304CCF2|nr:zinc finger protein RFP-like [Hemicordylus capensis]